MFYILPPKGQVALHILENCICTRLEYLKLLESDNTDNFSGNFEYLIENSVCDSIGHFTFRLIAAASSELWLFWVRSEGLLLKQRLDNLSVRQIHRLFRNVIKHLDRYDCNDSPAVKALMEISQNFLKPHVFNHMVEEDHPNDCRKYQCQVSFAAVPDLVKERKIDLYYGQGIVVCSEWKIVLVSVFRTFLLEEKKKISSPEYFVSTDPRLLFISKIIYGQTLDKIPENGNITAKNIDAESRNFPPCMQHLHMILRDKHRLSHHARVHYSLFLKECGMKLNDTLNYWREEYTKPHLCQSGCTHNWQTSEKKFIYSIRHLYGLEGRQKNYKAPNCKMICNAMPGLRYEGGCPFKHFDANKLGALLRTCMTESEFHPEDHPIIQSPEVACASFLKMIHRREGDDVVICSPVQYYMKVIESK